MKIAITICLLITSLIFFSCKSSTEPDVQQSSFEWSYWITPDNGLNDSLITAGFDAAYNSAFVNAVVIVRNGKICREKYFNNYSNATSQTVRSVSKSFLSAMIGIAADKGMLNLDQKFVDFYPEYANASDSRFKNITLRHLLTMQSGIRGDEEFYMTFFGSSNWVSTIANSSLAFAPGSSKLYSTAGTHLVSAILTKATGMSSLDFGNKYLFEPMGLSIKSWARDPQGIYFGGNDMYFTARDIALLGVMYLNNGMLNGRQIVPASWVNSSLVYSSATGTPWGSISKIGYGYLWWSGEIAGHRAFFALGFGGQYILCIPEHNLVIAVLSYPEGDWNSADGQERAVNKIIADYFIPAVKN